MSTEIPSSPPDLAHADVGLVCALHREVAPLLDRCERVHRYSGGSFTFRGGWYQGVRVAVVECGAGFERARRATQALHDAHTPDWIVSTGFSGALRSGMKVGDIVMADSIVDTHQQQLSIDVKMAADPTHGLHVGRIVTADAIARTIAEKQSLGESTGGLAVDLESLAVAQICRDTKTRFLAVRVISDDLSADLPVEVLSVLGGTGSIRAGAIVGALWNRPSSAKDMWKLREQANLASDKLARFLAGAIPQLASGSSTAAD